MILSKVIEIMSMLPEDIKYFVDALKKMGENFKFIAIEETKDTYKIYIVIRMGYS
jgi:hypothetical protein